MVPFSTSIFVNNEQQNFAVTHLSSLMASAFGCDCHLFIVTLEVRGPSVTRSHLHRFGFVWRIGFETHHLRTVHLNFAASPSPRKATTAVCVLFLGMNTLS